MTDDYLMRSRLQQVAAYRHLRRVVRRTGRENVLFAAIMLALAFWTIGPNAKGFAAVIFVLYVGLAVAEFAVGVFKSLWPSAEGVLLDALILLLFAGWNLGWQVIGQMAGRPVNPVLLAFGGLMLWASFGQFNRYRQLRKLFAQRPTADQIAWFDDLIREIRTADPELDDQALDLPTRPHWKAKLLGTTAFFVTVLGETVWVAGPGEFELVRETKDPGTGRRRAYLRVYDQEYPPFEITDTSWANYEKWLKANAALPPQA
jgi:hypothetical protein